MRESRPGLDSKSGAAPQFIVLKPAHDFESVVWILDDPLAISQPNLRRLRVRPPELSGHLENRY
jgi:hypothetical protein